MLLSKASQLFLQCFRSLLLATARECPLDESLPACKSESRIITERECGTVIFWV